ncbi:hypothetical protein BSK49_22875 [Paenibacillus odorifer]|jgi:iron complex transport system substrate-binding protein|uniref:ABC transporter substrate-binding protein n=2 Tax=Paenibacillus TaxID=44249 RepID=UPI00097A5170|nr:hypothetical protein BSK49_22875 [Paenibacillus odorifer]
MGDVNVPANPQRVVVDWDLGPVLGVGVVPVGASNTQLEYSQFLKPFLDETVQDIGAEGSVSFEKVLELAPDVIITWNKDAYSNYSKIAPTVLFIQVNTQRFKKRLQLWEKFWIEKKRLNSLWQISKNVK